MVNNIAHHIFHLNHILNVPYIDLLIASGLKRTDHVSQIHGVKCQIIDKFRVHGKIVYACDFVDHLPEDLQYFFLHRGKVLDVRSVYEGAWGEKYMPTSTNTVMVHILNLRKKLEEDPANPKLIRTIWGKGYQFG